MENNMVGWFEIPVLDMDRAQKFYETVFGIAISIHDMDGFIMGWFPGDPAKPGASGSLVKHAMYSPSDSQGALVYFSCTDVAGELGRTGAAGGEILRNKTEIGGGHGFMALIRDTEGNRIALHSLK